MAAAARGYLHCRTIARSRPQRRSGQRSGNDRARDLVGFEVDPDVEIDTGVVSVV